MPRPVRHLPSRLALGGLAATALLLTACGGSSGSGGDTGAPASPATSSAAPATTSQAASSTSAVPATSSSASPAPSSRATAAASGTTGGGSGTTVSQCAESQLKALVDPRPVGGTSNSAGDKAVIVDFRNTSSRACSIYGYPGAALVDSSGTQVKQATRTIRGRLLGLPIGQDTLPRVTLQPGAYASAGIEGVNQQEQGAAQAGCDNAFYPRILVTPPNTRTAVPFTVKWPVCYSFTVHPTNLEKNPPN